MKEKFLKKLGSRIREMRKQKKMPMVELGRLTNKNSRSILRLEKGEINCSLYYLCEIAEGLDTDIATIVKDLP